MTPEAVKEIHAAVDVAFLKGRRPVLRPGSLKWIGARKWGWYVSSFSRIATEQFAFHCSPLEYLKAWELQPRLMAIYETIQARMREKSADAMRDMESKKGTIKSRPVRKRKR